MVLEEARVKEETEASTNKTVNKKEDGEACDVKTKSDCDKLTSETCEKNDDDDCTSTAATSTAVAAAAMSIPSADTRDESEKETPKFTKKNFLSQSRRQYRKRSQDEEDD